MDLHHIREDYTQKVLSIQDCHANPLSQFEQWLSEALNAKVSEPTAMNIATVAKNGWPSSRMVLLKELNSQGFVFFTNYQSRKGQEIAENPFACLTFFLGGITTSSARGGENRENFSRRVRCLLRFPLLYQPFGSLGKRSKPTD